MKINLHLPLRLAFCRVFYPQVADLLAGRIGASVFQKVTQKIWFVVLVGLLLGLACGAVMAVWPSLRLASALVAIVGAVVLGRAGGVGGWLSLPVAAGVSAVAAVFVLRRGVNPWPMLTTGCVLGSVVFAWRSALLRDELRHVRGINTALATELDGLLRPNSDSELPDRNASVHPNGAPKYQRLPTPEDTRIERLARLLHNGAQRAAIEQGLAHPDGAFVEWDDTPERTRAGRRSQAAYLLAAGVVLPGDRPVKDPYAWCQPTGLPLKKLRDMLAELDTDDKPHPSPLWRQLGNLCPCSHDGRRDHTTYCEEGSGADQVGYPVLADGHTIGGIPSPTLAQPTKPPAVSLAAQAQIAKERGFGALQGFPTDEQIREWRWWERCYTKIVELFFDVAGNLIDENSTCKILRFPDGKEVTRTRDGATTAVLDDYRRDAWRKAPAPTTTQIAPVAADREAAVQ